MPAAARRPCTYPGCGIAVRGASRCERHRRVESRAFDARRGSARERGYTTAWEKYRASYLRENPLCRAHEQRGQLEPSTIVDHIVPHRGDHDLMWDPENHQPLCKPCHDSKTAREDGGFGNPRGPHVR
jgi:5-methylcytosine-specific restriction protein A